MRVISKTAAWLAGVVGALLMAAAATSPESAVSNLSGWARMIGINGVPLWLSAHGADSYAFLAGTALLICAVGSIFLLRKKSARDVIAEAFNVGTHLRQEILSSEDEYRDWKRRLDAWVASTAKIIGAHFGEADKQLFLMLPPINAADIIGSLNRVHTNERLHLGSRLQALRRLLERG